MKFSALVLSLTLSSSAAFAPSASRAATSTFQRFSAPVESVPAVEENEKAEEKVVMEATPAPATPVDLPVAKEEEKIEAPVVAAAEEEVVDKIIP